MNFKKHFLFYLHICIFRVQFSYEKYRRND
nr:MAG TPA: hypothetical protein [Caudoviricetes sp.]DAJ44749.1 MAG TPA: hypothetical protein [Caudoviricetes sp.]DAU33183.1 MAG TPA: hypothetical protein [Caudoviricetes sp.]DAU57647.1 MAG TPA: hypothetical protein [Caudoviricetes sp.]